MCPIVGSFNIDRLKELIELNSYRGTHSHSITYFSPTDGWGSSIRGPYRNYGPIVLYDILPREGEYILVHQQAPTTEDKINIHPAEYSRNLLWHNGILKESTVKELSELFNEEGAWDTKLLLRKIFQDKMPTDVDGSFACVWYDTYNLKLFRNKLSNLFISENGDMSSTRFEGGEPLKPGTIHYVNWVLDGEDTIIQLQETKNYFLTQYTPYYFSGEYRE